MKNSIEWHKECLKNQKQHLLREKLELEDLKKKVIRLEEETMTYEAQINYALSLNKDSFDSEKFNKKRTINKQ